jgi:hypothetical protein
MADNETGIFAARICAIYTVTAGGITYGDWYLPSSHELNLLYLQKEVVGGFENDHYWSSSESVATAAYYQNFTSGFQGIEVKSNTNRVRAIRAF